MVIGAEYSHETAAGMRNPSENCVFSRIIKPFSCSSEDRRGVPERLITLMQMLKFELVLLRHWR